MEVYTSTIANELKETLDEIDTELDKDMVDMPRYYDEGPMSDAYEDDVEIAGPGLASEKNEGAEIALGGITEGNLTRYNAVTYALKLIVTEEALEDNKYPKAVNEMRRLIRAMWQTVDVDAALQLVRGWDTNYVFGDGLPVFSASHTTPVGGTFSNTLATAMSPSRAAWIVVVSNLKNLPDHAGIRQGYKPKRVLCPNEQWATWETLVNSTHAPEAGQFNAVNVVNRAGIEVVVLKHWDNTTTNWAVQTDCDLGFRWKWRKKPKTRSWVENDFTQVRSAVRARWSRGMTNARCIYGSQA